MIETLQSFVSTVSSNTPDWFSARPLWQDAGGGSVVPKRKKNSSATLFDLKQLPQYSLSEVADHCTPDDCWIVIYDQVYDVTNFLESHPGGQYIVMEHAGRDATLVFRGSRHSVDAFDMLDQYHIGVLIEVIKLNFNLFSIFTKNSNFVFDRKRNYISMITSKTRAPKTLLDFKSSQWRLLPPQCQLILPLSL